MKEKFFIEAELLGMEKLDELEKKLERISDLSIQIDKHLASISNSGVEITSILNEENDESDWVCEVEKTIVFLARSLREKKVPLEHEAGTIKALAELVTANANKKFEQF